MKLPEYLHRDSLGEIFLAGHRIALHHVVDRFNAGFSPEMIVGQYPTLPLAHVYQVIGYYLANQAEVDEYVQAQRAAIDAHAAGTQPGPSAAELRRRLAAKTQAGAA